MDSGQHYRHPFPPIGNPKSSIVFLAVTIATTLIILSAVLYFLYHLWRTLFRRSRTRPCDSSPSPSDNLRRFALRELRDATDNFSSSNVIGKGGSGTVYRALLKDGKLAAVKLLDSSLYQFEMEFQNEVRVLGGLKPGPSEFVVSLLGFCVEKERKAVVYEYMPNKSLQECLFSDRDLGLDWGKRFRVIQDVARALAFLHVECDPPVIHGDVKPSNVLLDIDFRAKISDFGLSRLKMEDEIGGDGGVAAGATMEDNDEVDFALALQASSSSKSSCKIYHNVLGLSINSLNFGFNGENGSDDHKFVGNGVAYEEELSSVDHSKELNLNADGEGDGAKQWGKDWWWRQDGSGELCSKDYVMEWIGSQICSNPDNVDWDEEKGVIEERIVSAPEDKSSKRLDSCEEVDKNDIGVVVEKEDSKRWKKVLAVKKHRKMHEWWKEERLDDEVRKKKKKRAGGKWCRQRLKLAPHFGLGKCFEFKRRRSSFGGKNSHDNGEDDEENMEFSFRKGWRSKSQNHNNSRSMGSDMWSGDLFSRELSSTTSMRGTLCYVAPEYTGFGYLMEKADIYSFGVLVLVIISGRRPLHVLSSPMKLEQANLISWSRSLAQTGNILELVDERLGNEYSKEEASLCINLALACLQKMPELRPDIGDVVRILRGEMELPQLPYEFSPSPPAKNYSRSRRKQKITAVD